MARLHIYYNSPIGMDSLFKPYLKVKIDDEITFQIDKYKEAVIDLDNGTHSIKMYIPYMMDAAGFVSETLDIQDEDSFYYYKGPAISFGKGKLIKVSSSSEFPKIKLKSKIKFLLSCVLTIIILLLFTILIGYL
jgi:hypothetical protein